jgi:nitrate/nitrite transporter NarK
MRLFVKISAGRVLTISASAVVLAALLWSLAPPAAPALLFVLGFSTANLFPGLVSHISDRRPRLASATIAAIGFTGALGGTVVPALTGAALGAGLALRLVTVFIILPTIGAYLCAMLAGSRPATSGSHPVRRPGESY